MIRPIFQKSQIKEVFENSTTYKWTNGVEYGTFIFQKTLDSYKIEAITRIHNREDINQEDKKKVAKILRDIKELMEE